MVKSTGIRKTILHLLHSSPNPPELIITRCPGSPGAHQAQMSAKPYLTHSAGTVGSILKQSEARGLCPQQQVMPQVIPSYWKPRIHVLPQKKPGEGNHYFLKKEQKQTKSNQPRDSKKTACHTWNVTKTGFQLKHGKTLSRQLLQGLWNSAQSLVLGKAKRKWWAAEGGGEVSFNKNSLKEKKTKTEHSHFLFTITPPPPCRHHNSALTLCSTFYFVFKLHFKQRSFFFSQQYLTIPHENTASKP